jgi:hypothetical protein
MSAQGRQFAQVDKERDTVGARLPSPDDADDPKVCAF